MIENELPGEIFEKIYANAKAQFPKDPSLQGTTVQSQIEAWKYMDMLKSNMFAGREDEQDSGRDLVEIIFKKCEAEWPDDYIMQQKRFEKDMASLESLAPIFDGSAGYHPEAVSVFYEKAKEKWPDDISKQADFMKENLAEITSLMQSIKENNIDIEDLLRTLPDNL
jgi:hypothetical protein